MAVEKPRSPTRKGPAEFFASVPKHLVAPDRWVLPNQTDFAEWLTSTFVGYRRVMRVGEENVEVDPRRGIELFPHQMFVRDYMQFKSPYRGLLVYHGLGVGKSCTSIATAEMLMNQRKVVILLPASLQDNYTTEIGKCGNRYYDKTKHHWRFVPKGKATYVPGEILKRNGGYWEVDSSEPGNYKGLSSKDKEGVDRQIAAMIAVNYTYVNYNGVSEKKIKESMEKTGFFDNKVIIVDEAHNFISGVSNESKIVRALYMLMMRSKNSKIILLTGTPIINKPYEIAFVVNLLKGYQRQHTLEVLETNERALAAIMNGVPFVDTYQIEASSKSAKVHFTLVPPHFRKTTDNRVVMDSRKEHRLSEDDMLARITALMESTKSTKGAKGGATTGGVLGREETEFSYLPTNEEAFNSYFVDDQRKSIKNEMLFMRRILGSVSHFTNDDPSLYPRMQQVQEQVPMSDYQFEQYYNARAEEAKLEMQRATGGLWNTPSVYKTYSRTICNFVFPEGINRPKPKEVDKELTKSDRKTVYDNKVEKALEALYAKPAALNDDLGVYSPKFLKLTENVRDSPGNVLIYSQFSSVEGIEILSKILEKRLGFEELVLKHTDAGWSLELPKDRDTPTYISFKPNDSMAKKIRTEYTNIVLGIYNNDFHLLPDRIRAKLKGRTNLRGEVLRALFITQSGAEGISLKNVRQVHITEPYWNKNRIDQVIGRANRTNSHAALPNADRNFTAYMYQMVFSEAQLEDRKKRRLLQKDKNKTTDQVIIGIAERKHVIIEHFLTAMRKAAVDCPLNNADMGCFSFPLDMADNTMAHTLNIEKDVIDSHSRQNMSQKKQKAYKVTVKSMHNRPFIYVSDTGELFDYALYTSTRFLKRVGFMRAMDDGQYVITHV